MYWRFALRNVLRNKRRTLATVLAIALSCAGLLLFGGYVTWTHLAGETHAVTLSGHGQLFHRDYRTKGAGNPAACTIDRFDEIRALLLADEVLGPRLEVVAGQLLIQGMLSHADRQTSTPFFGIGAVPEDLERLARWNPYGIFDVREIPLNAALFSDGPELDAGDPDGVTLGVGLARILGIEPPAKGEGVTRPTVELLCQPPDGGMANMISASVRKLSTRQWEDLDNRLVYMPLALASDLLFPGEPTRVSSITLVFRDSRDLPEMEARLDELMASGKLDLEWRNYRDLTPNLVRSVRMMDMFFLFAFCIIVVVLVFTIYNTMTMSVMERVREIGTMRAMGANRPEVTRVFALEGVFLGVVGGVLGLVLGLGIAAIINRAAIYYAPPFVTMYAKLEVFITKAPWAVAGSLAICLLVALVGAILPSRRASRWEIVDALRH